MRLGIAYHGSRRLDHVSADLDSLAAAGAEVVVHCATEEDLAFRSRGITEIVAATRAAGLDALVDLWGVMGLFDGEAVSFAIARDPDIRQRLSDGTRVPAACPNHPRTGEWLARWLGLVADAGAHGILWDGPHLWIEDADAWGASARSAWSCACDACQDAWSGHRHGAPGGTMPERLTPDLRLFRQRSLTGLLGAAFAQAKAAGLANVLTVLPVDDDAPDALPLDDLAALPFVDGLGTEPFWVTQGRTVRPYVRRWSERVARVVQPRRARSHIWVSLREIPRGAAEDLAVAVGDAAAAGVDDLLVWVDPTPARDEPDLLPEDEAWAIVADAVRRTQVPSRP